MREMYGIVGSMPDARALEDWEASMALNRLAPLVATVVRDTHATEEQKLRSIGCIVQGTIDDIMQKPNKQPPSPVRPSVLPAHDDITIDTLARYQRALRSKPPEMQAMILERLEHAELVRQQEERPER